jgi:hypothetical protein
MSENTKPLGSRGVSMLWECLRLAISVNDQVSALTRVKADKPGLV